MFQVEESELDRLHSEQQTQGDNKYSTIQKVTMIDLLLARSGFGVGGGGGSCGVIRLILEFQLCYDNI